jgi:uncharacterized protein
MITKDIKIFISDNQGEVSAQIFQPSDMKALLVLAHGAGAGMNHRFMLALAQYLSDLSIGTLRYNFPYMENGKKRPDVAAIAEKTVQQVISKARELFPNTPLLAGGKSFGGRMTSQFLSKTNVDFVKAIVFFGFPLHPAGEPAVIRAEHLKNIKQPMLFLQGTRDALAELSLITKVCADLKPATLVTFDKADHSFKAGKKEFIHELANATSQWTNQHMTD